MPTQTLKPNGAGYDPHKKYVRIGDCRRCGRCCDLHCQFLHWKVNRDLKAGMEFIDAGIGQPIMAVCIAKSKPEMCANFPTNPWQTPQKCGYSWVEAKE